jgi:methionine-S-sulfoxide reductase
MHTIRTFTRSRSKGTDPLAAARTALIVAVVLATITGISSTTSAGDGTRAGDDGFEVAILAGGCFWGMEGLLRNLDGVVDTEVGYASDRNDKKATPAEAIRIVYDPSRISYEDILRFYFKMHDPTTKNRQGNDRGAEYRSAIFVLDERQREVAERVRADVDGSGFWKNPLVTEINEAGKFKEAAEHHQDYLEKNPGGYTCHYVRGG